MPSTTVNGAKIFYDEHGDGDQTIVWGHGNLASARSYDDLIGLLPAGYRSIVVDFRGFGRSAATTRNCTLDQLADDVRALTLELGIRRFVYIGHSMGNGVGMRLAANHPDLVQAAISIAGLPADGMPDDEASRAMIEGLPLLQGNAAAFAAALAGLAVHDNDHVADAFAQDAALVHADVLHQVFETELLRDDSATLLPKLTQPWLFLVPSDDRAVDPERQLATAKQIPGSRAIWFNSEGHLMPQENPAEVMSYVRLFLDGLAI